MTEPMSRDRLHEIILALYPNPLVGELTREIDRLCEERRKNRKLLERAANELWAVCPEGGDYCLIVKDIRARLEEKDS